MNPDPATDVVAFLTKPAWYTAAFWLLLIASAAIAIYVAARVPDQRSGRHVARWLFRLVIGAMWWQQTLWKLPPHYTDKPDEPFGTTGSPLAASSTTVFHSAPSLASPMSAAIRFLAGTNAPSRSVSVTRKGRSV